LNNFSLSAKFIKSSNHTRSISWC